MKHISDAEPGQPPRSFLHPLKQESMKTVVGKRIRAGQPFVKQQRHSTLIRQIRSERERMVRVHPPVHLRPIENVPRALPELPIVQFPDAFRHLMR